MDTLGNMSTALCDISIVLCDMGVLCELKYFYLQSSTKLITYHLIESSTGIV